MRFKRSRSQKRSKRKSKRKNRSRRNLRLQSSRLIKTTWTSLSTTYLSIRIKWTCQRNSNIPSKRLASVERRKNFFARVSPQGSSVIRPSECVRCSDSVASSMQPTRSKIWVRCTTLMISGTTNQSLGLVNRSTLAN